MMSLSLGLSDDEYGQIRAEPFFSRYYFFLGILAEDLPFVS